MGSSRLPGKVLMKLDKVNPMLYYVISQLQYCKLLDKIIVATSNLDEDKKIVKFTQHLGIDYFRGDSLDVLDRYYKCAKQFKLDTIVRVTADCPLIDPTIVDRIIKKYTSSSFDYVCMHKPRTLPEGITPEIFSFHALEQAWKNAERPSEREHVTSHFFHNPEQFKIYNLKNKDDLSHLRLTVDRLNDLSLIQNIISKIKKKPILLSDIVKLFSKEPDLFEINKNSIQDEGYLKSLKEDEIYFNRRFD